VINTIDLNLSGKCNLRCIYCFANHGPHTEEKTLMDISNIKGAIDWLFKWMRNAEFGTIYFFGGEPLLNWKGLVFAVNYAHTLGKRKRKKISFAITTNGTLLDKEKVAFMRKHNFGILISVDSHKPKINDLLRPSADKSGSFKKILNALSLFNEKDDVGIRATITENNLDIKGYVRYFSKFKAIKNIIFSPVKSPALRYMPSKKWLKLYKSAVEEYLEYLFQNWEKGNILFPDVFKNYIIDLANRKKIKQPIYCDAGREAVAFSANGDIYFCSATIGLKKFYLGNVKDGINERYRKKLIQEADLSKKTKCQRCPVKIICGGGCPAINYKTTGKLDVPSNEACNIFKFHLKCAQKILTKIDELLVMSS